jgi:hypothetical protein
MNYEQKYLKYKQKYIDLQNQLQTGGGPLMERLILPLVSRITFRGLVKKLSESQSEIRYMYSNGYLDFIAILQRFLTPQLLSELNGLDQPTLERYKSDNNELFSGFKEIPNIDIYHSYQPHHKEILRILFDIQFIQKHTCTITEFMEKNKDLVIRHCNNPTLVQGSCGDPAFFLNLDTLNGSNNNIISLLEKIKDKLERGKSIGIILGATKRFDSTCDINLYFNVCEAMNGVNPTPLCLEYENFSKILTDIDTEPLKDCYKIRSFFPLNTELDNCRVLDLILELTNDYTITLINQMCGSCFRSLYYLKQKATKNYIYILQPEQGLGNPGGLITPDSIEIRNCFKHPYNNTL